MCGLGYDVANGKTNTFWASDLLHRLYHVVSHLQLYLKLLVFLTLAQPSIGKGYIEHYLETYQEILDDAGKPGSNATHDSDVLQYFALDVYAYDIAAPGEGCSGEYVEVVEDDSHGAAASSTSASATTAQTATAAADVPPNCHTHEGGELHCD